MKRRMRKKGAMELSMNTIVVVVIGVTLLVLGLVFVRGLFGRITETTAKTFAGADTILEEMTGTEQRLNVQTGITLKRGQTEKIPVKLCNIEGQGDSLKLRVTATRLTGSGVTLFLPEVPGLTEINSDGQMDANSVQDLEPGGCVTYQMFVTADPNAPVTVGAGPILAFKAMVGTSEYGSTGSVIAVEK